MYDMETVLSASVANRNQQTPHSMTPGSGCPGSVRKCSSHRPEKISLEVFDFLTFVSLSRSPRLLITTAMTARQSLINGTISGWTQIRNHSQGRMSVIQFVEFLSRNSLVGLFSKLKLTRFCVEIMTHLFTSDFIYCQILLLYLLHTYLLLCVYQCIECSNGWCYYYNISVVSSI